MPARNSFRLVEFSAVTVVANQFFKRRISQHQIDSRPIDADRSLDLNCIQAVRCQDRQGVVLEPNITYAVIHGWFSGASATARRRGKGGHPF
jgi:hypothetical protein